MRYRPYSEYLKQKYGGKVYKLPVNLPITCPNKDGNCGVGGCIYCGDIGAAFENLSPTLPVSEQIRQNMEFIGKKYKAQKFIAYFQNYTNTYMPYDKFCSFIKSAVTDNIVQINISTRPDCINDEYMSFLKQLSDETGIDIGIELGLQTVNYKTLKVINRGHTLAEFIDAVITIHKYGFEVCAHLILNLPWDDIEDGTECAKILSALKVEQVKLHSLYIMKNTPLEKMYTNGEFSMGEYQDYIDRVIAFLEHLSPDVVIQRLIGRAKEEHTVFANYGCSWWKIKDEIDAQLESRDTYQGKKCTYLGGKALKKFEK